MDAQAFALLMAELKTIKSQNEKQLDLMIKHVDDDNKVRVIVERHSTYFGLMSLGIAPLAAFVAHKLGWKI
jgi:hypothetical protein